MFKMYYATRDTHKHTHTSLSHNGVDMKRAMVQLENICFHLPLVNLPQILSNYIQIWLMGSTREEQYDSLAQHVHVFLKRTDALPFSCIPASEESYASLNKIIENEIISFHA